MKIYSDGGCHNNGTTDASMYGSFACVEGQQIVHSEHFELDGQATNNVAEYLSLLRALEYAQKQGWESVEFCTDSQLVVGQVTQGWKVNLPHLRSLVSQAKQILSGHPGWSLKQVPRTEVVSILGH